MNPLNKYVAVKNLLHRTLSGLGIVGLVVAALLSVLFLLALVFSGPLALGYSLAHLVPLVTHHALVLSWWAILAVVVVGFFFARFAIPVGLIVWLLVVVGILA